MLAAHRVVALGKPDRDIPPDLAADVRRPGPHALHQPLSLAPFPGPGTAISNAFLDLLDLTVDRCKLRFPMVVVVDVTLGVVCGYRVHDPVVDVDCLEALQSFSATCRHLELDVFDAVAIWRIRTAIRILGRYANLHAERISEAGPW